MSDFWSRRRARVEAEAQAERIAAGAAAAAEREAAVAERTDAELLADLDLPDPDTLEMGADFRAFLKDHVPHRLKTRALRRMWRVNPVLANLDGLNDYDDDYRAAPGMTGLLKTSYRVGKGMMPRIAELTRQAEARAAEIEAEAEALADPVTVTQAAPAETAEPDEAAPEQAAPDRAARETADSFDPSAAPPRRRMQFSFSTEGTA